MLKFSRITKLVILVVIFGVVFYFYGNALMLKFQRWVNFSFCDTPIFYEIGTIDPIFNLSKEQFSVAVDDAANIWNEKRGNKLFVQNTDTEREFILKINLVNDGRHKIVTEIADLNSDVESEKNLLETNTHKFEDLKSDLENDLAKLNKDIEYWNDRGGAPKEEYERLLEERRVIQERINELNELGKNINKEASNFNSQVSELNQNINTFNSLLNIRPEMGIYTSGINEIEIYFYSSRSELVHVLAHEMGHALGLKHITDPTSIMDPITSGTLQLSALNESELSAYCENRNRLELIKNDISNALFTIISTLNTISTN